MLSFFTDEDFDHRILRAVLRQLPNLDFNIVQNEGLSGVMDQEVLVRAVEEGRLLLTHDRNTMTDHAYLRMAEDLPCPGVIVVPKWISIGQAAEDIQLIAQVGFRADFENQIIYLPLKSRSNSLSKPSLL
jgi:hypothetical protein